MIENPICSIPCEGGPCLKMNPLARGRIPAALGDKIVRGYILGGYEPHIDTLAEAMWMQVNDLHLRFGEVNIEKGARALARVITGECPNYQIQEN